MEIIKAGARLTKTIQNAGRLRHVVGVFAKHGFHKIAEQIKLGRFLLERFQSFDDLENLSVAERVRMSFEELGPTFVKLGQLLATRPDLVPLDYVDEFSKLHDNVQALPFETIESVLKQEFGNQLYEHFSEIEKSPLGSASIAQVHKARLSTGEHVVVKVQRPGIIQTINEDLSLLFMIAELLEKYVDETRSYNPVGIVNEFFKTLALETNFVVEANNIRRFQKNFAHFDSIYIPKVYMELTTERVLTLEELQGMPLSKDGALNQPGIQPQEVIRNGLKAYMKMVFADGLFHGDLHPGNFFILPNNRIGLIDFGVVGHLNRKFQTGIANMLLAQAQEDYERLAYEYVDLAPFTDQVNVDLFAKDLRDLIAPYYGLNLKNINIGRLLLTSSAIASKHRLILPTELMMYFRSIVHIESIGRKIQSDFDFLSYAIEVANDLVKHQIDSQKITAEISQVLRESKSFLTSLPRQLSFFIKKVNSPNHAFRFQIDELKEFRKTFESSFNLIFLGLIIGTLILSASLISVLDHTSAQIAGLPTLSFIGYILALFLGFVAFFNYIRK
ncbi:MAG TPA: AarF/ABC1/UbiB kinase family protein [Pseudobdellovibrionaceae bacterium]|nr:AarF/ABC1/UbiB kinase family protein [Pseudobdellovibrionaceae bacterium]